MGTARGHIHGVVSFKMLSVVVIIYLVHPLSKRDVSTLIAFIQQESSLYCADTMPNVIQLTPDQAK